MCEIVIKEKTDNITYEELQSLLARAHASNKANNLHYATATQTVEKLKEKLKSSKCFVAMADSQPVGMIAVEIRDLHYWYHNGTVAVLKLLGIAPEYKGKKLSSQLLEKCIDFARESGINVVVMDSAEQNAAMKHLAEIHGFLISDYGLYAANNFYTVVYVRWLDRNPHSAFYRNLRYHMKRFYIRLRYKPGKIKRFRI